MHIYYNNIRSNGSSVYNIRLSIISPAHSVASYPSWLMAPLVLFFITGSGCSGRPPCRTNRAHRENTFIAVVFCQQAAVWNHTSIFIIRFYHDESSVLCFCFPNCVVFCIHGLMNAGGTLQNTTKTAQLTNPHVERSGLSILEQTEELNVHGALSCP